MLRVYFGRNSVNREKFIFEKIKGSGRTLLLVPDQFTLQAEREAFRYLQVRGFADLDIISMNRLGQRILSETGGHKRTRINKYGRHMLVAASAAALDAELGIYKGMWRKNSFLELANDFIIDMKQYNTTPSMLAEIAAGQEEHSLLRRKLSDILKIYSAYEERIKGKYLDSEDFIDFFLPKLAKSELVTKSTVWIYGYEYFTPKMLLTIGEIIKFTDVNIVLTSDDNCADADVFTITAKMRQSLANTAQMAGIPFEEEKITGTEYAVSKNSDELVAIERQLFSIPPGHYAAERKEPHVRLLKAPDPYAEAEAAAAYVLELTSEKGLRHKDILLICNDLESRASGICRVFREFGIDIFVDRKESITSAGAVVYILTLLEIFRRNFRTEDLMLLLKTGFSDVTFEETERLENYAIEYRIDKNRWRKPFRRGIQKYGEEGIAELEEIRRKAVGNLIEFEKEYKKSKTPGRLIVALYDFLVKTARVPEKLEVVIAERQQEGDFEEASRQAQIWGCVTDIFDQIVAIVGDDENLAGSTADILRAGLEEVQIGTLPPSPDTLMLGTMQRTRAGEVKALVVIGANEGILPSDSDREGILSETEKEKLLRQEIQICRLREFRSGEEILGIYKLLSKPEDYLWMSYADTDAMGAELKPSKILTAIEDMFSENGRSITEIYAPEKCIGSQENTLKNLINVLQKSADADSVDARWLAAADWYRRKKPERFKIAAEIAAGEKRRLFLEPEQAQRLYSEVSDETVLSPSRLERYSRCPFDYFILFGLRPEERRVYEIAGREIGDIYHECLMRLSRRLTKKGTKITAPDSPWMTITPDECRESINEIIDEIAGNYKEGVLSSGNEELYRTERLKENCMHIADAMIYQVRQGKISSILCEEPFGKRSMRFAPIEVPLEKGKVLIEGKIDRIDTLENGSVKIIDYKSGNEKFDVAEVESGWRLQLMLYLQAAQREKNGESIRKPAGVFYFKITEPELSKETIDDEAIRSEIRKCYKLDGVTVNDLVTISEIDVWDKDSNVLPLSIKGDGTIYARGRKDKLLSEEDFAVLQRKVRDVVRQLCGELVSGDISVNPKSTKSASACDYCKNAAVCHVKIRQGKLRR
ncbi:MAG: PD-(D/E)XK nuclease family protein [Clostridia bacterium]|nr:PD-(D/E)XK nuclease family protein [Clostridia bacterium]